MLTAAMTALVEKFDLKNQKLGEVAAGAVIKHSRDWNLARESHARQRAASRDAGLRPAARVRHQPVGGGAARATASRSARSTAPSPAAPTARATSRSATARSCSAPCCRSCAASRGATSSRPSAACGPATSRPPRPASPSRAPACRWASTARRWRRSGRSAAASRTSSRSPATRTPRRRGRRASSTTWSFPSGICSATTTCAAIPRSRSSRSLRTAFDSSPAGTLTAGNSSPLTDGAACVLLASEDWAQIAQAFRSRRFSAYTETAAVDFVGMSGPKEGMLMAPAYAVPRMLDRAGLKLQDFDIYEIHEAFAAQVLCTLKAWESEEFCREKLEPRRAGQHRPREDESQGLERRASAIPSPPPARASSPRSPSSSPSAAPAAA